MLLGMPKCLNSIKVQTRLIQCACDSVCGPIHEHWLSRSILTHLTIGRDVECSDVMCSVALGDQLSVSHHTGSFSTSQLEGYSEVLLLAAGTGITPMTKLLTFCVSKEKKTHIIFFNKTERDIIWREDLEDLQINANG